ncbi:MAG TPA: hypothetical protein VL381_10140 [Rhodocyclaceae bacterium]|nr:hypothetical protein [Rhodocyclaceae bacterium]
MTPAETNLINVAKRYTLIATQVSQAYSAEQAKLNIELVLAPSRLSSSEGTQQSLESIERLSSLTETHKTAIEKIFLACAADFSQAIAALTESQQAEHRGGILKSVHGQLAAQSQFYENRSKWIRAAKNICTLLEAKRKTVTVEGDSILFAEESDQERFAAMMDTLEEAHTLEAAHTRQMLEQFSQTTALLGLSPQ